MFTKYKGIKSFINIDLPNAATIKATAITLKNAHPDALIIIGSFSGVKHTLAVASSSFNAKEVFDEIASNHNGRGGGNEGFAMGSMEQIKSL